MWIFLALLIVPLVEIALFIQVGGLIGLWPTIAIVIFTAIAGAMLLRAQGLAALGEVQGRLRAGQDPGAALAHGALILVAGVVLLTPGFFTDAIGFLLLVPQVRSGVIAFLARRITVAAVNMHTRQASRPGGGPARSDTVEGEYEVLTPEEDEDDLRRRSDGRSGWSHPPR